MNSKIPKRIIQTNKSLDLPLLEKAAVANVRLLHPDYEYRFFDDRQVEEFINSEYPEYRDIFHSFSVPIQKYDFFRYLAVYRLGGFYLDMDVFLASNLSGLLESGCVFPFEALTINAYLRERYGMDWEIGNYAFGATAGHPFLYAIIQNCVKAQKELDWAEVMMRSVPRAIRKSDFVLYTTGPLLVSRTLAEFPDVATHVEVLFPEDVCDSHNWNCFGTFGVHLMSGGWRNRKGVLRMKLIRLWKSLVMRKMLKESKRLGGHRSLRLMQSQSRNIPE